MKHIVQKTIAALPLSVSLAACTMDSTDIVGGSSAGDREYSSSSGTHEVGGSSGSSDVEHSDGAPSDSSSLLISSAEVVRSTGDPSTDTTLARLCGMDYGAPYCGREARYRWGSTTDDCSSGAPAGMPIVAVLHAHGGTYDYTDYDYLLEHLAKNGFMAVSVDMKPWPSKTEDSGLEAAQYFQANGCFDGFITTMFGGMGAVDKKKFGIVGHSRGGEAGRWMAKKLQPDTNFKVRAVVGMSPLGTTMTELNGTMTLGYLALYSIADDDDSTAAVKSYRVHDRAGDNAGVKYNEKSTSESTTKTYDLYRAMKLFAIPWNTPGDLLHRDFSENADEIYLEAHSTTKGYVLAFLTRLTKGDTTYWSQYIQGSAVPGTFAGPIFHQYSDGGTREVIDNGERTDLYTSTIGGSVIGSGLKSLALHQASTSTPTPHDTRVIRVETYSSLSASGSYIKWAIPSGKRDWGNYCHLSLRFGQVTDASAGDVEVGINNSGVTAWKNLGVYSPVPTPVTFCNLRTTLLNPGYCLDEVRAAHMQTIRIPLADFGSHNDVTDVYVRFQSSSSLGKTYILDNLELSDWCGPIFR